MSAVGGESSHRSRLDLELVERGLARSRSHAQSMIGSSLVQVNEQVVTRAAERVAAKDQLSVSRDQYVSRASHKLLGALDDLGLRVFGRALDAGASTGGFTQVLLERGCAEVIAIDVGADQLAPSVRHDDRVHVWERTNLRDLELRHVDGKPVDLVVADVSFISLLLLLDPLLSVVRPDGRLLLMIKPQFEVGRAALGKGGVVRSDTLRRQAVDNVRLAAGQRGWPIQAVVPSRLPGPAGNLEFFALLARPPLVVPDETCSS